MNFGAQEIQFAAYFASAPRRSALDSWRRMFGAGPDTQIAQHGVEQCAGTYGDHVIVLQVQPGRQDFFVKPVEDPDVNTQDYVIGVEDAIARYRDLFEIALAGEKYTRVAMTANGFQEFEQLKIALKEHSSITGLNLHGDERDALAQVRRRERCTGVPGGRLMVIRRWFAHERQLMMLDLTRAAAGVPSGKPVAGIQRYLDVATEDAVAALTASKAAAGISAIADRILQLLHSPDEI